MPSTMIHLLVARSVEPDANPRFYIGSYAPDYAADRKQKDAIHLRNQPDRWTALEKQAAELDPGNAFEEGWLLHLFTDACWDEAQIPAYIRYWERLGRSDSWFPSYREEIGLASFFLYNTVDWSQPLWEAIAAVDPGAIQTSLPITAEDNRRLRDRLIQVHKDSDPASTPAFYTMPILASFAAETEQRYRRWRNGLAR